MNPRQRGYVALCYHYIRPATSTDKFFRLQGLSQQLFRQHIEMLLEHYHIISPDDALNFSVGNYEFPNDKPGILLTFDDGLSDHFDASEILHQYGLTALLFLPTCALIDGLPANPNIVHYCVAKYGVQQLLAHYDAALDLLKVTDPNFQIHYEQTHETEHIEALKQNLNYLIPPATSRTIFLNIYGNLLQKEFPNAIQLIHLSKTQITRMLFWGHALGAHSHTHVSLGAPELSRTQLRAELLRPKEYLRETFNVPIHALAYPFGETKDCLTAAQLRSHTSEYTLAFSGKPILNTTSTPSLELGRYMVMSTDSTQRLREIVDNIVAQ